MARTVGRRKPLYKRLNRLWLRYEYKHTTIAIIGLVVFVMLFDSALLNSVFDFLKHLDYFGAFMAGVLAASLFTAAPALVLITQLATVSGLDPLWLALLVGIGSAVGDMILLFFFEEQIFYELRPLFKRLKIKVFTRKSKRRQMSAPLLLGGAFIIMTPLPDEIGLGMLGISHFPRIFIFIICLALNTLGNSLVILTARAASGVYS